MQPDFQIKTSANLQWEILAKKEQKAVLPSVLIVAKLSFWRQQCVWKAVNHVAEMASHRVHLDPTALFPVPTLVLMQLRSSCAQSLINTDRHLFLREDIDYDWL